MRAEAGGLASRILAALGTRCHACGAAADAGGARDAPALCACCREALAPRMGGWCPRCGAIAADPSAEPTVCGDCRREPRPWESLAFHGIYEGLLKNLITDYKFKGRLGLGRLLQSLALSAWRLRRPDGPVPDALVPVPLHPRRLAWRGFNQSLEMSRLLAADLDRPLVADALRRVRHTVPQAGLSAGERMANVRGAFEVCGDGLRGRSVLLVDDIMTTGGTLAECARTLARAGAARVDVLVLARTSLHG